MVRIVEPSIAIDFMSVVSIASGGNRVCAELNTDRYRAQLDQPGGVGPETREDTNLGRPAVFFAAGLIVI